MPESIPTTYRGITMRSRLEAGWAATLDDYGIEWHYEPHLLKLKSGELYLPDFWLPALGTVLEAKGPLVGREHKPADLAIELPWDYIEVTTESVVRNVLHARSATALAAMSLRMDLWLPRLAGLESGAS